MYVAEGQLAVRKSPEFFVGQFGLFYKPNLLDGRSAESPVQRTGGERYVKMQARWLRKLGRVPAKLAIEEITTIEQAKKYALTSVEELKKVDVTARSRPDFVALMEHEVPENYELLSGYAKLWEEQRRPTSFAYLHASGVMISHLKYDAEAGWQEQLMSPEVPFKTRTTCGIMTTRGGLPFIYGSSVR